MKKVNIKILLFSFFISCYVFAFAGTVLAEQIIIESDEQFEFARIYMEKGEYVRAVNEFERFIHFFPEDSRAPMARYFIGVCYLEDASYEAAREIFFNISTSGAHSPFAGKALFLIGESYYRQGVFKEAGHYFRQVLEKHPAQDLKDSALYRLAWVRVQDNRWQDASEIFSKVEDDSGLYDSSQHLAGQSLEGNMLPHKSPAVAGSLAIIPGLGHAYVSRYKSAAVAFLVNALFTLAALESFNEDHDALGGALLFFEAGWYGGNIYSAINAAHKYNKKAQNDFKNSLKDRFDLHLLTSKQGHIGLGLAYHF
ncbi:MAG: tetratricopeptide repeat protein [Desulfobacterales bacterium]|nr:tetratricopeptide repeat protein [Desulfobacterales bacterium]